jgi:hypothetical protein
VALQVGTTYSIEVTEASITLNQNMTCSTSFKVTETDGGTYTLVNGTVTFTWDSDGSTDSGSIVGSQITLTDDGTVLIFRK